MGLTGSNKTEYQKEYMRRKRAGPADIPKAITPQVIAQLAQKKRRYIDVIEDSTGAGLITDELGQYMVLSDGQRWYPGREGYHPGGCQCGIQHKERD